MLELGADVYFRGPEGRSDERSLSLCSHIYLEASERAKSSRSSNEAVSLLSTGIVLDLAISQSY